MTITTIPITMPVPIPQPQITAIKHNKNYLGLTTNNKSYIVGFKHMQIASKVMHHLQTPPNLQMMPLSPTILHEPITKTELEIDSEATLFIPKKQTFGIPNNPSPLPEEDPMELIQFDYQDFIMYPITKQVGIIIPYVLILEDEVELIYQAHVITNPTD